MSGLSFVLGPWSFVICHLSLEAFPNLEDGAEISLIAHGKFQTHRTKIRE
jgi:hypothetical protein